MKTARQVIVVCMTGLLVASIAGPIQGQTPGGSPYKWIQRPDETSLGLDVKATMPIILADDFWCTSTGPITNIQVWGSWLGDYLPYEDDPTAVSFRLQIYGDIPDPQPGNLETWSMPAETVLWERMFYSDDYATTFTAEEYTTVPNGEGWYDPNDGTFNWPADYTVWQYNFDIPVAEAFVQEGTAGTPIIYWLALEAFTDDIEAQFGWKTSIDHWHDDAVWRYESSTTVIDPNHTSLTNNTHPLWGELRYPLGHEYEGDSIDLAFAIVPEPITLAVLVLGMIAAALRRRQRSL